MGRFEGGKGGEGGRERREGERREGEMREGREGRGRGGGGDDCYTYSDGTTIFI